MPGCRSAFGSSTIWWLPSNAIEAGTAGSIVTVRRRSGRLPSVGATPVAKQMRTALLRETTPLVWLDISALQAACCAACCIDASRLPPQDDKTNMPTTHRMPARIHCRKHIQLRHDIDSLPTDRVGRVARKSMRRAVYWNAADARITRYHSVVGVRPDRAIICHDRAARAPRRRLIPARRLVQPGGECPLPQHSIEAARTSMAGGVGAGVALRVGRRPAGNRPRAGAG